VGNNGLVVNIQQMEFNLTKKKRGRERERKKERRKI
jgi:hypothetical protein